MHDEDLTASPGESSPEPSAPTADLAEPGVRVQRVLRRVRRRLFVERFLRNAAFDLIVFGSLFVVALLVEKLFSFGIEPAVLLLAFGIAWLVSTVLRSLIGARVDRRTAAVETDLRLGLEERVSSAVWLEEHPESRSDRDWHRLVLADGARSLDPARVRESFPLRMPRFALFALLPALVAVALWLWVPALDLLGLESDRLAVAAMKKDVDEREKRIEKKLAELEKRAERAELPDVRKLLQSFREDRKKHSGEETKSREGQQQAQDGKTAKKKALVQVQERTQQLRQARQGAQYKTAEKALEKMAASRLQDASLTRKMQSALKKGDLQAARKELDKLRDDVRSLAKKTRSQLTPEELARLEKLSAELSRLAQKLGSMGKLSKGLEGASGKLGKGELEASLEDLKMSDEELARLAKQLKEMELLDESLDALEDAEEELAKLSEHSCPNCNKPRKKKPGDKPGGT